MARGASKAAARAVSARSRAAAWPVSARSGAAARPVSERSGAAGRPVLEGLGAAARPVLEGSGAAATARTASGGGVVPLGTGSAASPQPAVGAMGRCASPILLRPPGKMSAICERRRSGSRRRDGGEARRSFGDDLSGNLNRTGSCDYDADFGLSHMDSFSSSDKENAKPGRKSVLDDALFQFFRKEAIKSLKRDFSKFCEESVLFSKNKRFKEHSIGRESFTSYSIKYFCDISKSLTFRRKEIIVNDSKIISISKDSVHFVTGLPNSGSVPMPDSDGGAKFILKLFGLSEMPHITFFGNKLKSQDVLTDTEVFVCFMVIAFKCFLFPTSNELPNTDYLSILEQPESASSFDVCALVFEHLISGVYKYNKSCKLKGRKPKVFEFCYYFLAVYYLDSLDFGARIIDQSVPRISVWNGNLVKFFSDLDHTKNNIFGKRHLRKNLSSCYTEGELQDVSKCVKDAPGMCSEISCFSLAFKNSLHLTFGSTLEGKIIDGIIDSFQSAITSKHPPVCKSEGAASLDSNKQISSEAKLDIASNLGFINQKEFLQTIGCNSVKNNFIEIFGNSLFPLL
ncbi:uncharacterized protein LOC124673097 [Lolium rigidum]|uniref:uncharacterized protein LOC124673097 n=1 Tax=Lolium rigidum TaxID=89674 RepID=UPI001F5DA6D2|nr:uncharacterized protein LOC124673097 [Lolium rigidum]